MFWRFHPFWLRYCKVTGKKKTERGELEPSGQHLVPVWSASSCSVLLVHHCIPVECSLIWLCEFVHILLLCFSGLVGTVGCSALPPHTVLWNKRVTQPKIAINRQDKSGFVSQVKNKPFVLSFLSFNVFTSYMWQNLLLSNLNITWQFSIKNQ